MLRRIIRPSETSARRGRRFGEVKRDSRFRHSESRTCCLKDFACDWEIYFGLCEVQNLMGLELQIKHILGSRPGQNYLWLVRIVGIFAFPSIDLVGFVRQCYCRKYAEKQRTDIDGNSRHIFFKILADCFSEE